MAVSYQLVIDCASPELLAHFWADALHYVIAPPPSGFDSWDDFYMPSAQKMRNALPLIREAAPWLEVDGEMHGDAALDAGYRTELMPRTTLSGEANLLVLPNIDSANISYNLLKQAAGGGIAIGPVLLGAAKPVHILTPSATVRRLVNMTAVTVADANAFRS